MALLLLPLILEIRTLKIIFKQTDSKISDNVGAGDLALIYLA